MAIAGTLAVNILARTDKFQKGIKGAQKSLKGFRGQIAGVGKALTSFSGLLIGAVGVGSAVAFTKSTLKSVDALAKTSDKLGIATEDLGRWRFAAGLAGIEANTLDLALQRMVRRIGQASQGTGEAQKTLAAFGLDAKKLVQLDPSKQFKLIGENINAITNKGEQLAAAMSLFDTEGVGLVNLFASNLGDAANEFERLGLAVSRADAAKIEQFNDAASKLAQSLSATGRNFVIGISDDALESIRALTTLAEITGLIKAKDTAFTTTVAAAAKLRGKPAPGIGGIISEAASKAFSGSRRRAAFGQGGAITEALGEFFAGFSADPRSRSRRLNIADEADRERRSGNREQRRQTQILLESLELQRRAVLSGGTTVTLEPATFE